jgi:hypothetical protein
MPMVNFDRDIAHASKNSSLCSWRSAGLGQQTANQVCGKAIGDFRGTESAIGAEPENTPI